MSFTILERRGLERERRMERIAEKYGQTRVNVRRRYKPDENKSEKDIKGEARAKLEKQDFFKRD